MPPSSTAPVVADRLADEDLDVPEAPLQDRVREGERDEDERHDRDVESSGDAKPRARGSAERSRNGARPTVTPSADPADLLLGLRRPRAAPEQLRRGAR